MKDEFERIGQLLVESGVLTNGQVDAVLEAQRTNRRPFGQLAETLFGIQPAQISAAWAMQYARRCPEISLGDQTLDMSVLTLLSRRQAWQFQLLPLRIEDGVLVVATTAANLVRACNFAWRQFCQPVTFVLVAADNLQAHLRDLYPWSGAASVVPLSRTHRHIFASQEVA